MSFIARY